MDMEELEIIIPLDGTVQIRTRGFSGGRCLEATKEIEEIAGTLIERNLNTEYFLQEREEMVLQTFNEEGADRK
jgi:hypothetical protein